jgi:putative ABC transport system permease protein
VAFIGGVAGVVIGAWIVGASLGWMVLISAWVCAGTLIFSTLVGLLSGMYPAHRGSRMDPMDAMRYA